MPYSVWTVITPSWAFSVTTDKSTYEVGEPVQIRVTLKNVGFIAHSFTSAVSDPVAVIISSKRSFYVWFNSLDNIATQFTVLPNQSLERTFIWNQTYVYFPDEEIEPDTYWISAFIPNGESDKSIGEDNLFWTSTSINITSIL